MSDERGVLRRVAWRQVFPWLIIFRVFRIAINMPVLFLATIGTLMTPLGWWAADWLFIDDDLRSQVEFAEFVEFHSRWPLALSDRAMVGSAPQLSQPAVTIARGTANVPDVYWRFTSPFQQFFSPNLRITQYAYFLFGGLWNIAVWSIIGGAITRIAAVQLGREERVGWREALRHAFRNFGWYFFSPLFPLLGVLLLVLPIVGLGLLLRFDVGVIFAAILWPIALLFGIVIAAMLLGLVAGWPLMWPTISSEEGSDAFEAFSRSYSYTYQRPLQYLFYAVIVVAFGGLCWLLVWRFADVIVSMCQWSAAWGSGNERVATLLRDGDVLGSGVINRFHQLVRVVAVAFNFSFFWCASTAVYLLLRRDVDQIEFDEVFVEDEQDRYGLPPLKPSTEVPTSSIAPPLAAGGDHAGSDEPAND